jgi:hypothetical protein
MRVFYLEFEGAQQERFGARFGRFVEPVSNTDDISLRPLYAAVRAWLMHEEHGLIKIKDRYTGLPGFEEHTPEITLMLLTAKDVNSVKDLML